MDERRTLAILAWTVGSVVGMMFILNGIALSSVESTRALTARQVVAGKAPADPALRVPAVTRIRGG
jgi:hypothetical protein